MLSSNYELMGTHIIYTCIYKKNKKEEIKNKQVFAVVNTWEIIQTNGENPPASD